MQATEHESADTKQRHLQLRILTGAHEGACVALRIEDAQGVHLSNHGDADIWITDAALFDAGNAWLYADAQRWVLLHAPLEGADTTSLVGDQLQAKGSTAVGEAIWLGDVCLVVCDAQAPWQDPKRWACPRPSEADAGHADALPSPLSGGAEEASQTTAGDTLVAVPSSPPTDGCVEDEVETKVQETSSEDAPKNAAVKAQTIKGWVGFAVCATFMCAAAGAVWWVQSQPSPVSTQGTTMPVSAEQQERQVQEARMVIAMIDPGLRLQIDPRAQGGVRISGWLPDQNRLDQVIQALASLRPLPQVALRTVAELNDLVQEVGHNHGLNLVLRPQSTSSVQVSGMLGDEDKRQTVIQEIQQRLPTGMQLVDGLYAPAAHIPVVIQWLKAQGLDVRDVVWKDQAMQLQVRLRSGQRRTLEQALLRKDQPLYGIPFRLLTTDADSSHAVTAKKRLAANSPGVPVLVRTVVGGTHPYLVTMDGHKLQLGAQVGAWRLIGIASDHVLWDGPQRLEVTR